MRPASSALSAAGRSGELIAAVMSAGICVAGIGAASLVLAATGCICARTADTLTANPTNATTVKKIKVPIRILIVITILRVVFGSFTIIDC